jgi:hypothetical protein
MSVLCFGQTCMTVTEASPIDYVDVIAYYIWLVIQSHNLLSLVLREINYGYLLP